MSYCRFSSLDYGCDLYCYESADGGFITHVARNRVVGDVPHFDWKDIGGTLTAQQEFLKTAERKPIGLPFDGKTFSDPTEEDMIKRVKDLIETGYRAPEFWNEL